MRRLEPRSLQQSIAIQLRVLRGPTKTALQHLRGDQAAEEVARLIIERCLAGLVIYAPDRVPKRDIDPSWGNWGDSQGRFGVSEPFPPQPPDEYGDGRCKLCSANDIDALGDRLAEDLWRVLVPKVAFADAGVDRANFLTLAHRAINSLSGLKARDR